MFIDTSTLFYLVVDDNTLIRYTKEGKINFTRTDGGNRRCDIESFLLSDRKEKYTGWWLERQVSVMKKLYPEAVMIKDIGSGINYNRKGVKTILELILRGDRISLVVANRDRFARFGTELFEFLLKSNGGELLVLSDEEKSSEQKFTEGLLTILHVFSCRVHGSRKYKKDKDKT